MSGGAFVTRQMSQRRRSLSEEFPKTRLFKIIYTGNRPLQVFYAPKRLLRLNVALFDNARPLGDFSFYIFTKLGRCHCHGRCAFAIKLRLQFG